MRAFRIAYDGRPFHGFQRQPDVATVEGRIFDALGELGVTEGKPEGYTAAGRTDAGASAVAQTVAFECPEWLTPVALDSELPASIRAWASAEAPAGFHATRDAAFREYVYHCYAPEADLARAEDALSALRGEHDFHNLTPDDEGTVRELEGEVWRGGQSKRDEQSKRGGQGGPGGQSERGGQRRRSGQDRQRGRGGDGEYLVFRLRAGGFARQLVRRVVSLVRAVATGDAEPSKVERVLGSAPVEGPAGVAPAPAYPLVLADVGYPGLEFSVDEDAAASTREAFEALREERATGARVAREVLKRLSSE